MAIERIIGIDFGTSTSVIKVKTYKNGKSMDAGEMADFVRFENRNTLPTLIYRTEQDEYLIGYDAESPAVKGIRYQNFKLDLIHQDADIRQQALSLIKIFFQFMYKAYEEQKTIFPICDLETTYVSYPAKWPDDLCQTMMSIAAEAGFQNVHGMDEPTAAIHAVLIQKGDSLKEQNLIKDGTPVNILMVDMGAGTTDLVLCKYTPGSQEEIEFLNTWPKAGSQSLFGGREIDTALCTYVKNYLTECGIPNLNNFDQNYMSSCKVWKEANVSPVLRDNGLIKYCGFADAILNMFNIDSQFPVMDRTCFEALLADYLTQLPALANDCVADTAEIDPENIDLVILTGGHSQWYFVNEMFAGAVKNFGTVDFPQIKSEPQRIVKLPCPQETVALGLVYKKPAAEPRIEVEPDAVPVPPQPDQQSQPQHSQTWQSVNPTPQQAYPAWNPQFVDQPQPQSPPVGQSYQNAAYFPQQSYLPPTPPVNRPNQQPIYPATTQLYQPQQLYPNPQNQSWSQQQQASYQFQNTQPIAKSYPAGRITAICSLVFGIISLGIGLAGIVMDMTVEILFIMIIALGAGIFSIVLYSDLKKIHIKSPVAKTGMILGIIGICLNILIIIVTLDYLLFY